MPYKIMKTLFQNRARSKEELLNMADVYYAVNRLTEDQYTEIIAQINIEVGDN